MERLLAASQERKCSVFSAMKNPLVQAMFQMRTQECIQAFLELIQKQHQTLLNDPNLVLSRWADEFLNTVGYYGELKRAEKDAEAAEARVRNVRDLLPDLDEAGNSNWTPAGKVEAFLDDLALDNDRKEEKEAGDAVTLITMHSCKGLEFPHVFVVGLEEGLLPHSRSKVEGTLSEERRLFYVAITRAMKTLTLSHCETRKKYGQPMPCHPSQFLKELPEELVEHANATAKQPVKADTGKSYFASMREALG
jgi:superfamily I DNA/RNA helicase